jgi:hypothetical protein
VAIYTVPVPGEREKVKEREGEKRREDNLG